jgi:hypothetical protein
MIHFICFADNKFINTLKRIELEALNSEFFNKVVTFSEDFLDEKTLNYCYSNGRGFGYWSWKSYIVYEYMKKLDYGDILVYSDAGNTINVNGKDRFKFYIDYLSQDYNDSIFFHMPQHLEKTWTKMDAIDFLDSYDLIDTGQIAACSFLIKKTDRTVELVKKWRDVCYDHKNLIDDTESKIENDGTFSEHRHDQSILSILVKKMKIELFEDDTWKYYSHGDNSYPINCTRIKY